jgi:hypothetical protein
MQHTKRMNLSKQKTFKMQNDSIAIMAISTAAGWFVSLQDLETVTRIISLIVPTVLSVLVFVGNRRKNRK